MSFPIPIYKHFLTSHPHPLARRYLLAWGIRMLNPMVDGIHTDKPGGFLPCRACEPVGACGQVNIGNWSIVGITAQKKSQRDVKDIPSPSQVNEQILLTKGRLFDTFLLRKALWGLKSKGGKKG
jgi:hypothetical protein